MQTRIIRNALPILLVLVLAAVGSTIGWPISKARTPQPRPIASSTELPVSGGVSSRVISTPADLAIDAAEAEIARHPQQTQGYVTLAAAFMRKARECGNADYYLRAEAAIQHALAVEPGDTNALLTLAWVQTGKHEFRAALTTIEPLHERLPNDARAYGLLGDALVELGEYDRAAAALQKMIDLRPDLQSYSRAAYMRELFGDTQGALDLMAKAVRAGTHRDPESLAWCWVQYGDLHFGRGDVAAAEAAYQQALTVFPQYHLALAPLGRVRAAQSRSEEAIVLYRQALAIVPTPDVAAALGDLLRLIGKADEAEQQYTLVEYIEQLTMLTPQTYSRQIALFYADHDRHLEAAIKHAEAALEQRRDIYSYDTLAWAYYKNRRLTEARDAMAQALRLGTQDALLLFHAGMIAYGLGEKEEAKSYLRRALVTNPYFSLTGAPRARDTLQCLQEQRSCPAEEGIVLQPTQGVSSILDTEPDTLSSREIREG
jgi:tetratricopeptide (TPR) repeat protein